MENETKAEPELKPSDPGFLPTQYDLTETRLAELADQYNPKNIPPAKDKGDEGYNEIHEAVMKITRVRTNIERVRKDLKADALAWGRKVDGEAKRLSAIVEALEKPWRKIKEDIDNKEKREAEERRQAQEKRLAEIERRIAELRGQTEGLLTADSGLIAGRIELVKQLVIDEESFGDYIEAAVVTKQTVLDTLQAAYKERLAFEEQKAEMARQQAQLDALAAENRKAAQELADQKAAQEAAEAAREAERQAKEKAEREEKERQEAAAAKAKAREEREAAAAKAEAERKATLKKRLPEDIKVRDWVDQLLSIEPPELKDKELRQLVAETNLQLVSVYKRIDQTVQKRPEKS